MEVSGRRDLGIASGKQVEVETRTDRTRIAVVRRHVNDDIDDDDDDDDNDDDVTMQTFIALNAVLIHFKRSMR